MRLKDSKYTKYWLFCIILLVFLFRMYFSLQISGFNDDYSYRTVSIVSQIIENPLELQSSLYYYVLAVFYYLFPSFITLKTVNNIICVLIILLNFALAKYITNEDSSSLLVALVSGFIPIFLTKSFNTLQPFNLFLLLFVFQIYNFIKYRDKFDIHFYSFVIVTILLPFVSPLSILLAFSLLLFIILAFIEKLDVVKPKIDLIIFTSTYLIWSQFLIYKKAFLELGPNIIYQNIPSTIVSNYFADTTLRSMILEIGFIPFAFGIFIIYFFIFKKQRFLLSLFPFFLVSAILVFFRLIALNEGLMLIGELFVLIFMFFFKLAVDWIYNSKFDKFWWLFLSFFALVFFISAIMPATIQMNEIVAQKSNENTPQLSAFILDNLSDETILIDYEYGFYIESLGAKSILNQEFYKIANPEKILVDLNIFYSFTSSVSSTKILQKYGADYFLINKNILEEYSQNKFRLENDLCTTDTLAFIKVYDDGFNQIYKRNCDLWLNQ